MKHVLAVDIGTTRTKGIIVDEDGKVISSASITHNDQQVELGQHEQDAEITWWGEFVRVVRKMLSQDSNLSNTIESICITGMFSCFCPTEATGTPLYHALLYDDNRALEFARRLSKNEGELLDGNELLARFMWLRQNFPEKFMQMRMFFSPHNFIIYRLTNKYCIDVNTAFLFGRIFNHKDFSWRKEELSQVGLDESIMPPVFMCNDIIGYVTVDSAKIIGIQSGVPVVVGTGDLFASLIGCGVSSPDDVMIHLGSGGSIIQLTDTIEHFFEGKQYASGNTGIKWLLGIPRSGKLLEQYAHIFTNHRLETDEALKKLDAEIEASSKCRSSPLFFFNIDRPREFATVTSPMSSVLSISLEAKGYDIFRAIYEGFGYSIRQAFEGNSLPKAGTSIYFSGGGAKSHIWCQTITTILNSTTYVCDYTEEAYGGALIAGYSVGLFSIRTFNKERASTAKRYYPQMDLREYYESQFLKFCREKKFFEMRSDPIHE